MIGAIIGDIVGSKYEFHNHRSKDFEFFGEGCKFTDDSVMTIAVAKALMESKKDYTDLSEQAIKWVREIGLKYPFCGYGFMFFNWLYRKDPQPYGSYGNGAAMRISPVGWVSKDIDQAKELSRKVTEITHNHPEGIKGAECVAIAIFLARQGKTKDEIKKYVTENYYMLDFTIDKIRPTYQFNETCQDTVPQALQAFFESISFEDAIRIAISVGGDSDTLACITGGIAEAYYSVPEDMARQAEGYLDVFLLDIVKIFDQYKKQRKGDNHG